MSKCELVDRDLGWAAYFRSVSKMKSAYAKVGVLDDGKGAEKYPDGSLSVAEVAAIHEFGTEDGHIPSRSFLRSTFDEKRPELEQTAAVLSARILAGKSTIEDALNRLGALLTAAIKNKISTGIDPPNAPSTAIAKASKGKTKKFFKRPAKDVGESLAQVGALAAVKPLIDTGRLLNAITWALEI